MSGQQNMDDDAGLPELFEQFMYTSDSAIFEQHSYYNFTNRSSVSPDIQQFGIKAVFTPPYYFGPCDIGVKIFDETVAVDSYVWYPSESVFKGAKVNGIATEARALPLYNQRGGIYEITLRNVSQNSLEVPVQWAAEGTLGMETDWQFNKPDLQGKDIIMDGTTIMNIPSGYYLAQKAKAAEMSMVSYGTAFEHSENGKLGARINLKSGESITFGIVFVLGQNNGKTKNRASEITKDIASYVTETRNGWNNDLKEIMQKAPRLEGFSDEIQKMYDTGLLSLLSVTWEVPEFIFSPWIAACGIDGGAMISYLWDHALPSKYVTLLAPEVSRNHILAFAKANMYDNYAVNPATGEGVGPFYSYNYHGLALLVYDYVSMTGDFSILDEPVDDGTYLDFLYTFCLGAEDLNKPADLVDYGSNENLLELKKTDAYQYFTPSPNAERLLIYDMLTELHGYKDKKTPHDLIKRKKELSKVFKEKLWNEKLGWPNTLDQKGNPHVCYSIQVFDALRTGVYTKDMEKVIVAHLNEKEFLSDWGVHSLSKLDAGYDPNDVDWWGPGIYTIDGPELMTDLFNAGFFEEGIDLLNRISWWGELPYYPQAMRSATRGYREDGRSNLISGVGVSMHLALGLFRMKVTTDSLKIHPIEHEYMKGVALKGFKIRGKTIDVQVGKDGERYTVSVDRMKREFPMDTPFRMQLN
ncbi:hypothetical protein [Pricia sp.]|uniref:hypothetical protein n=1 Tax=Pricia sp. TaxID=2268138 RepID=UPI00359322FA